jgi:hypothetical protein
MDFQRKSTGRLTQVLAAAGALALVGGAAQDARAQDLDGVAWAGVDFSNNVVWGYAGTVIALDHELGHSGFNFRFAGFGGAFDYNAGRRTVDATGGGIEFGVGYQWNLSQWTRISTYVNGVYRSFETDPDDPNSDLEDEHWGIKLQFEFDHRFSYEWGINLLTSYTFIQENYWTRVRGAYWLTNSMRVGPELTFYGGDEYDRQRVGAYIEGIPFFNTGLEWGVKAGYQYDSRNDISSAYGGVSASFSF